MRQVVFRLLILFFTLRIDAISLSAHPADRYSFSYYQIKDGLSDEFVSSAYQDSQGYIWVCTTNGLDRFDGTNFIHYNSSSPNHALKIRNNSIIQVVEDHFSQLWCISDAGLMKIDLSTGYVDALEHIKCDNAYYLSSPIQSMAIDSNGDLWLGLHHGLLFVDMDEHGQISKISRSLLNANVRALCEQGGRMWAAGPLGIKSFVLNKGGEDNSEEPIPSALSALNQVTSMMAYGNYLWIGTRNGLFCYNSQTANCRQFRQEIGQANSLSSDVISSLSRSSSGEIFIGTQGGLDIYSADSGFQHIGEGTLYHSLNTNDVNHVFVDKDDCIWVSTMVGGLNKLVPKRIMFRYKMIGGTGDKNVVNRVFEDKEGNLWIGIMNKGLAVRYANSDDFVFISKSGIPNALPDNNILAVRQDYHGDYWIATRAGGLFMLRRADIHHPKFISYTTQNSGISSNTVFDIVVDEKRHGLWLCNGRGIDFMDLETCTFQQFETDLDTDFIMPYVMFLDSHDRLWIGGNGLGVIHLSIKEPVTRCYRYKLDDPDSKILERIATILETEDGSLYFGSQCNGLFELVEDEQSGLTSRFRQIPLNYGQFKNKVSKLIEDRDHRIWISTLDGIYLYSPKTTLSIKLDIEDGLPLQQFYVRSGRCLHNGSICFGSMNGLLEIDGHSLVQKRNTRQPVISYAMINDSIVVRTPISRIDLHPGETLLEIGFSVLDYMTPRKTIFEYMLKGVDKNWIMEPIERKVRYASLSPGEYIFCVRCTNDDNSLSDQVTELLIVVHPPFYQTPWFYALMMVLFLSAVLFCIIWYYKEQKRIQRRLSDEVESRTDELARTMEKANSEKLMLYTSLTHEFRTPLTLILGPLQELKSQNRDSQLNESIQMIDRNSRYMLTLVDQIMDLRKVDSGLFQLNLSSLDISSLMHSYVENFRNVVSERGITIEYREHLVSPFITCDSDAIHKITYNLISNAAKYTPHGGHIVARIAQWRTHDKQLMQYLSVSNTGSYIDETDQEHIFDCFYKVEGQHCYGSQSSSGIGLYVVKQLTDVLGGKISVKSSHAVGTTFRLYFPVDESTETEAINHVDKSQYIDLNDAQYAAFTPLENGLPVLLLVEDNSDMRLYIKRILSGNFQIAEANNGDQGYKLAKDILPDFIITDLMMPVCDGLTFCRLIRNDESLCHIPILMLTALSNDDARLRSYNSGVDAFLTKPFDQQMLVARVQNIILRRKQLQKSVTSNLAVTGTLPEIEDADLHFIQQLSDILQQNYMNSDFGTAELLGAIGMGATTFYKKITSLTGLSASQYIRLYRLQSAKKLLESHKEKGGTLTVSEVAYSVGFNDPKYFTRCFTKQYGIQPSSLL